MKALVRPRLSPPGSPIPDFGSMSSIMSLGGEGSMGEDGGIGVVILFPVDVDVDASWNTTDRSRWLCMRVSSVVEKRSKVGVK